MDVDKIIKALEDALSGNLERVNQQISSISYEIDKLSGKIERLRDLVEETQ